MINTIVNTDFLADFLKVTRATASLTQDQVHERGAPYRQLQGRIESADPIELELTLLGSYDRAYGWPIGYAAAVAQVGAYAIGIETPAQNLLDHQLHPSDADSPEQSTGSLFADLCEGRKSTAFSHAAIGFDPATGRARYCGFGLLTNVGFADLLPLMDSRTGTTIFDTQLLDRMTTNAILHRRPRERAQVAYRLGPYEHALAEGGNMIPIALDALTDMTTLSEARRMTQALLDLRPDIDTTVERAAFTFLAIAAFGEDPFTTIRRIQDAARTGVQQHPDAAAFYEFWAAFRERHDVSSDLFTPDLEALRLLDQLARARESAKSILIGSPPDPGEPRTRYGRSEIPATTRMENLVSVDPDVDTLVFYDSSVAPHVPVLFKNTSPTSSLAFYRVDTPPGLLQVSYPGMGFQTIGIAAEADDLDLLAHHQCERIDTLTNHFGQYAVFCESGRAAAVWIPPA